MSIHLNICHNNYDCIVKWPFTNKITVTLLDQCVNPNARRHVSHVLDPVTMETKGAFDRPKGGKSNSPFGVPKFIHLDDLLRPGHYVKDDCLFIHVKIDDDWSICLCRWWHKGTRKKRFFSNLKLVFNSRHRSVFINGRNAPFIMNSRRIRPIYRPVPFSFEHKSIFFYIKELTLF